jgi:hypothetical protein
MIHSMAKKKSKKSPQELEIKSFIKDIEILCSIPTPKKYDKLLLEEYPFDNQLLNLSRLYRESRRLYCAIGGTFKATVCSTLRGLSAQDLFKDEIAYTPSWSELHWFKDHAHETYSPKVEIDSLTLFNGISLFHEQNHRIIWRLLPPPPAEERALCRYLNFAESLVVILDLALGDEIGEKLSPAFERMKVIYRPGGKNKWKAERKYSLSLLCSTYFALEMINYEDILNAVDYILPNQKEMNRAAVRRGLELSELFTRVTNPLWQERYWKTAHQKLERFHQQSQHKPLYLPEDPLDLGQEFAIVYKVLDYFGL